MKKLALLLLVISVGLLRADQTNSASAPPAPASNDWTVNGRTYHDVHVGTVEADQVHITYDGGIGSVPLAALPPDIQKQLGYDPQKAATAAQIRDLQAQVSNLTEQNAELRAELSRYKGTLTETQAAPKVGIEAFHCYLYQFVGYSLTVSEDGRTNNVLSGGQCKGMSKGEATIYAQQQWEKLPDEKKAAYEKMAQETGDPIVTPVQSN